MKKQLTSVISLTALAACMYISACKTKKEVTVACTSSPTYTADIKQILDRSCMPCHSAEKHKHNIDLSNYETSKAVAKRKKFMGSINHESGYEAMPMKHDKLSDAIIEKLSCWVQNGMAK